MVKMKTQWDEWRMAYTIQQQAEESETGGEGRGEHRPGSVEMRDPPHGDQPRE